MRFGTILGWFCVGFGFAGLVISLACEIVAQEPVFLLISKGCLGLAAIGGTILGVINLPAIKKKR